ncbi:AMP-binding protein [Larsenimonas suaedae]|uniref:AMP-binding protein n=1 Tax=Larsenimonas suaedae TaxID=1851019 RepID=A0ABU1GYG0_9GAMM|nr:AMP-binding protein [Larsenimonas suaedae]MCM2973050.1 AMP-binding protein [Larsenimonas suaedae]MDR5896487.1 AMP-binding protein [Larsenimonas suaedae]
MTAMTEQHFLSAPWQWASHLPQVATSGACQRDHADFCRDVARWQQAPLERGQDAILVDPDPWSFTCALLACWHRGVRVILPNDGQPDTLAALAKDGARLIGAQGWTPPSDTVVGTPAWGTLSAESVAIDIFTSGSSGTPQRLAKTFRQLAHETCAFSNTFPLDYGVVVSQVSLHHIYGLSAALLRALTEGLPFSLTPCRFPEDVHHYLHATSVAALVSSPAQLERLPEALEANDRPPQQVFSSGAPLSQNAAVHARRQLGCTITEIYGSSETGAIAWRDRTVDSHWQPFDDTDVRADGELLCLRSPRLATPGWVTHADRVRFIDARRFELLGRADRIVKVGGKRISLEALERTLAQQPNVLKAHCVQPRSANDRIAAIVQLTPQAVPHTSAERKALIQALRDGLQDAFETIALPRYFRFVEHWPVNAQGKLTRATIMRLFQDLENRDVPRWLGCTEAPNDICHITYEIPEHLRALEGHFPGLPIVPGVALVHWALQEARTRWPDTLATGALERLKFPTPVRPGMRITLTLEHTATRLAFTIRSQGGQHASGRLRLEETAHD